MDTVHLDRLGAFVKSKKNAYLVVGIDAFTKFVFMRAVPNTKTLPVTKFLTETFETFGVPRQIICDRGTAFTSKAFTEFCTSLGIRRVLCATATPPANGQVERMNRTILSSLMASRDDESRWDEAITRVRWGINRTVSSATGKTPYEVFFGYRPRGLGDAFISNEVVESERLNLSSIRDNASNTIAKRQSAQKELYDSKHARPKVFKVNQQVLVRNSKTSNEGQSRKLEPRYKGPYVITMIVALWKIFLERIVRRKFIVG